MICNSVSELKAALSSPGTRLVGLDLGEKTIGLALSDPGLQVASHPQLNHSIPVVFGVLEEECRRLLQEFFKSKR